MWKFLEWWQRHRYEEFPRPGDLYSRNSIAEDHMLLPSTSCWTGLAWLPVGQFGCASELSRSCVEWHFCQWNRVQYPMNHVNNPNCSQVGRLLLLVSLLFVIACLLYEFRNMSLFDQVFQEELEGFTLFGHVALNLVVEAVLVWVLSAGSNSIAFGYLKNGLSLILLITLYIGFVNTMFTPCTKFHMVFPFTGLILSSFSLWIGSGPCHLVGDPFESYIFPTSNVFWFCGWGRQGRSDAP